MRICNCSVTNYHEKLPPDAPPLVDEEDVTSTYMNSLRKELNSRDRNPYTLDVITPVKEKIKEIAKEKIRVYLSNGKA